MRHGLQYAHKIVESFKFSSSISVIKKVTLRGKKNMETSRNYLFSNRLSREYPGRMAVVGNGRQCTYEEMHKGIAGLSGKLSELGVQKGTRVALFGYNSANWLIAFFSIVRAGGVAVLLNYSSGVEEAAELLKMSDTRFLLSGETAVEKKDPRAMEHLAELAGIEQEHCLSIHSDRVNLFRQYGSFHSENEMRTEEEAGETAFIIFTSGTTSMPKAVEISQKALSFDADAMIENLGEQAGRSLCTAVPLFHILGLLMSYTWLCRGCTVCLPANYKPETLIREIDAYRISDMTAVGAVYLSLAEAKEFRKCVVPYLHLCMIAGGMSTPVQMMRLELEYANATFINMYGQSEAAPLTMVRPSDLVEKRAQTVGRAVSGLDIRISDGKGGFLPVNEIGEVIAKGDNLMNGYYALSREKQPIDEEGWLHTGDLGYFDEDNYLHLSGRIKDVIIRGGENISPSEIENALSQLENVNQVKVMGAPHPIYGESVEACITLHNKNAPFDPSAMKESLRSLVARFKIPSHIFLYDSFPLNVNGKLDQRTLRVDMLSRLKRIAVSEELSGGVTVFDVKVKNSSYAIVPVTTMVNNLADTVGFSPKRAMQMQLAVEEMLTERIMDAYSASGEIRMKITLMPEWLRISFSDHGTEYFIDKRRDTSLSARIILKAVSDFHTDYPEGKPVYCMDFLYDNDFSIEEFLFTNREDLA